MRYVEKDLIVGLFYLALGAAVCVLATGYRMGSATEMGPGFFPIIVGGLLALVGTVIVLRAIFRREHSDPLHFSDLDLRSLATITLAVVTFGLCVRYLGVVVAVFAVVILAGMASKSFSWKRSLLSSAVLALFTVLVFVKAFGLRMPLWPAFFGA